MRVPVEEEALVLRLLTALLREDVGGLRTGSRPVAGGWLALGRLRVPVRRGVAGHDLLADLAPRAPYVVRVRPGRRVVARRLGAVVDAIGAEMRDPDLAAGFRVLRDEALAALVASRLRRRSRPGVLGRVRREALTGWAGHLEAETLAAQRDHPLYPTSAAKAGLSARQVRAWAPEHRPSFELSWYSAPYSAPVERQGRLPGFWPVADAFPLHPATPPPPGATPIDAPGLTVRPTLSLRTVAPVDDPSVHLKLPMPVRTLGRLNLRSLPCVGLADAGLLSRTLTAVRDADDDLRGLVGVADETTWLYADPMLAVLVRRWPAVEPGALIAPVAALPMLPHLATGAFVAAYLRLVLTVQVTLWLRHGIVLEAHPQNVLLVVPPDGDLRLLVRDLDSARIDPDLLGRHAPATSADPRLRSTDPVDLADLFVTTTLHQCVAATLIDLARARRHPAGPWLRLVRPLLAELADRHAGARDTPLFVRSILDRPRLPVKRHLTAATLLPKHRTGAVDVNKFYGADAPSYL